MNTFELLVAYREAFNRTNSTHIRDEESGIDVYIKQTEEATIITPWGSCEEKDWRTNFSFFFKRWIRHPLARRNSHVRVHGGYITGYMRIREEILKLVPSCGFVLVTGYSMGGGLAEIIALDIAMNRFQSHIRCLNVDGPKVWNKAGAMSFAKRVTDSLHIKYGNDIVTKIPPFYRSGAAKYHIGPKEKWWKMSIQDHLTAQNTSVVTPILK